MMAWPQMTVAVLLTWQVVGAFFLHGRPHPPWCFSDQALGAAVMGLILYSGGFWE